MEIATMETKKLSILFTTFETDKIPYLSVSTAKTYTNTFKHVFKFLKFDYVLSKDSQQDFQRYIAWRLKTSSIYQMRKDVINLNCFFHHFNIKIKLRKPSIPEKMPKYILPQHLEKLLSTPCYNPTIYHMFFISLNTGMRSGEICNLRWCDIQGNQIILGNGNYTKNKKIRIIPINQKLMDMINTIPKNDNEFIFNLNVKTPNNWVCTKLKRWFRDAGIPLHYNFHSARHTAASRLVQANISIYTVSTLLGHQSIQTTSIYAKLNTNVLMDAVNLL